MKVVLFGSGNVASVLGRLLLSKHHSIVQVVSRNAAHARVLADELHCDFTDGQGMINRAADIYIIAISDSALYELDKSFNLEKALVVHTAGSIPGHVLKGISMNYGVLYPLQSLRKEMENAIEIPFLVDGNSTESLTLIEDLARTISPHVTVAKDEERLKLHLAAVIVNNFTNHLYALAESFCEKEQVDFNLLKPLIRETANRISSTSPALVQTGPALRNDMLTIEKHLRLLKDYPRLKNFYLKITASIMEKE